MKKRVCTFFKLMSKLGDERIQSLATGHSQYLCNIVTISQVADCFYNKFDIKEKLLTSQPFALPLNNYSNSIYTM